MSAANHFTARLGTLDYGHWTALALLGYWSPWLTHPAGALRFNGFELAEWTTFLPGVRDGSLPVTRLSFLIPLACLVLLLGIAAARSKSMPALRWGLMLLALLCSYGVFPSYPYILTAYRDPEFRLQFLVACAALLGLGLTFFLKAGWLDVLQI